MIVPTANRLNQVEEYFFSKKLREVAQLRAAGHDVINLGIGSPDLAASDKAVQALCQTARQKDSHGYQPYHGTDMLRRAMGRWYTETYDVELDSSSEILPLLGSKEGIFHTSMAFLNPGDRVLVPNPGYPAYAAVAQLVGADPVFYDLKEHGNWLPDLDALAQMDLNSIKLMWVNYPHMPTGAVADSGFFEKLIRFAQAHKILICHDNPYSLILNTEAPLSILSLPESMKCCIELNSLSKSHNMAGWRIGMVCGAAEHLAPVLRVKSNMDSGMFLPIQAAAAQALTVEEPGQHDPSEIYRQRRECIYDLFDTLGCSYQRNCPGLFVWARVPAEVNDVTEYLNRILYKAHVFLTPGIIFGSNGKRYVRASLCAPEERMREATTRLRELSAMLMRQS